MVEYAAKAFKGQERVRKDAAFACAGERNRVAAGEHNGAVGGMVCGAPDEAMQFTKDAVMDPCL